MKNSFISLLAVALGAAALFTSCEKEQSVFSPESLPGSCTVTGVITYNEGVALVGDQYVTNHEVPAAGQVVMLSIPNGSYDGTYDPNYNQGTHGSQIYTDTLDAEGRYEFTIPAPAAGNSLSGKLEVIPFKAPYAEYIVNANQLVEYDSVQYTLTRDNLTIRDQFPQEINATAYCTTPDKDIEYSTPLIINGSITGPGWDVNPSSSTAPTTGHTPSNDAPVGIDVVISVYINGYNNNNFTIYYVATSDNTTGEYSATINLPEDFYTSNASASYSIQTVAEVRNFTNWYQYSNLTSTNAWASQEIELYYEAPYPTGNSVQAVNEYRPIKAGIINIPTTPITDLVYGLDPIVNPGPNDPSITTPQTFANTFEWNTNR